MAKNYSVQGLIQTKIGELNNFRVEYDRLQEKYRNMESELSQTQGKLTKALQDLGGVEGQFKNISNDISGKADVLVSLNKELPVKQAELNKLKEEIDQQIEENRIKEEKALKGVKNNIVQAKEELNQLNVTQKEKTKEKETLLEDTRVLRIELEQQTKELGGVIAKMDEERKQFTERSIGLMGRENALNVWEKKIEFHNKRLQWIYKKMDMQFK